MQHSPTITPNPSPSVKPTTLSFPLTLLSLLFTCSTAAADMRTARALWPCFRAAPATGALGSTNAPVSCAAEAAASRIVAAVAAGRRRLSRCC